MRSQELFSHLIRSVVVTLIMTAAAIGFAQSLHVETLDCGTEVVLITEPLSAATTVAWPDDAGTIHSITRGELNLLPDVEAVLAESEEAPPVLVVTGGSQLDELRQLFVRLFEGRTVAKRQQRRQEFVSGTVDRRLGAAGADAVIRMEVPLPAAGDPQRSTIEVLWELVPDVIEPQAPGVRSRIEGDVGLIEETVAPEVVETRLDQLRFALARAADSPQLEPMRVQAARSRIQVRRAALLSAHPEAAKEVVSRWQAGGIAAVQELLFGAEGVTEASVRRAAREWLPQHPGRVTLILPPRVFNPRFAPGPRVVQLDNDLMMAVLERPNAGLSVVNLRPVLLPDVDGQLTATVLARVAAELRRSAAAPGWIRVVDRPPALEIAAEEDRFPDLIEVLTAALDRVASDDHSVDLQGADARRRALQMMAEVLGLSGGIELSPAALLSPGNLAMGAVAPDAETAIESVQKFRLGGGARNPAPVGVEVPPEPRLREATAGKVSTVVVVLDLGIMASDVSAALVAEIVRQRVSEREASARVEMLRPVVPGRLVALLVVTAPGELTELERRLARSWETITGPVAATELGDARRRVAAEVASAASGPLGRARLCAAVAVGHAVWRKPADYELEVLSLPEDMVSVVLTGLPPWAELETTGAGVLPIPGS
jgi:hypothetical protein